MYSLNEALKFDQAEVFKIYKEFSNLKLPDIYKKFSFGRSQIHSAQGCVLRTSEGVDKFDMTGGLGVANFGHNNQRILRVRDEFVASGRPEIHKSYLNPVLAAASFNLSSVLGHGLKYSFFCNSGGEAVDGALKITYKKYNGMRKIVLHSNRSFHGKTIGAGSLSAGDNFVGGNGRFYFQKIPGVVEFDFNNVDSIKATIDSVGASNIYAIFLEPYSCSTVMECSREFLETVRDICNKNNICLVYDEIYSGFGKCGYDFYFHKYGVVPDVICLSKALGGGKASISAYVAKADLFSKSYGSVSGALTHSSTYNSFGEECATVIEACRILQDEKISQKSRDIEELFINTLSAWEDDPNCPLIGFRGAGSHFGLIFTDPFKILKPLFKAIPIDYTSDTLFASKLYVTSLVNAFWEDADCLCSFTSNQEVILNISPAPIACVEDLLPVLERMKTVLERNPISLVSEIVRNSGKPV
jgi:putrescine aminotransferase